MKLLAKSLLTFFLIAFSSLNAKSVTTLFKINEEDNLNVLSTIKFKDSIYIFAYDTSNIKSKQKETFYFFVKNNNLNKFEKVIPNIDISPKGILKVIKNETKILIYWFNHHDSNLYLSESEDCFHWKNHLILKNYPTNHTTGKAYKLYSSFINNDGDVLIWHKHSKYIFVNNLQNNKVTKIRLPRSNYEKFKLVSISLPYNMTLALFKYYDKKTEANKISLYSTENFERWEKISSTFQEDIILDLFKLNEREIIITSVSAIYQKEKDRINFWKSTDTGRSWGKIITSLPNVNNITNITEHNGKNFVIVEKFKLSKQNISIDSSIFLLNSTSQLNNEILTPVLAKENSSLDIVEVNNNEIIVSQEKQGNYYLLKYQVD